MRCYLLRDGRIRSVQELSGLVDNEAIAQGRALFAARQTDSFEVWDRARMLIQFQRIEDNPERPERGRYGVS
jgi:hypothetical protein